MKKHVYHTQLSWTGNIGKGTNNYTAYERSYVISVKSKPELYGSSDPSFRGDKTKYNPEELLVASLSSCHMLWYLHLCSVHGIIVLEYQDKAKGEMIEEENGAGYFKEVVLFPAVKINSSSNIEKAIELHHKANEMCFISNSMNFPVLHQPKINVHK